MAPKKANKRKNSDAEKQSSKRSKKSGPAAPPSSPASTRPSSTPAVSRQSSVLNETEDGKHSASESEDEETELGMSWIVQLLAEMMSDIINQND
jgi:hypothetical protein